jgi:hypothetical protein
MTITTIPQRTTPTTEYRDGQARHRGRTTDLWLQERHRETRGQGARHRMEDYSARELRDNCRVDAAQHRACRGEDAVSA